jgi:hypothetical protein
MEDEHQTDYEDDLKRVKTELNEKTIRLRDVCASTSNEDATRFKEYLSNRITQLGSVSDFV